MNKLLSKFKNSEYSSEKLRFLFFAFGLFAILYFARYLLGMAYSRYEVRTKINANISKALYIFEDEKISFNLDPSGIIPTDDSYVYKFSVSNFNASKQSDVDLSYHVKVRTTTNLPVTIRMYRNELYDSSGATNILAAPVPRNDEDSAWYRMYENLSEYEFYYQNHMTDVYTLVVDYPSVYSKNSEYANSIESIEVILESKQIIQEELYEVCS